jgi:hypothetical protein
METSLLFSVKSHDIAEHAGDPDVGNARLWFSPLPGLVLMSFLGSLYTFYEGA